MTTKTVFLRNGTQWRVADELSLDMHQTLPAGNYTIVKHPITEELMFERTDPFSMPAKLYGPIRKRANRIISTYLDRPFNTGVLLAGEKGSGKTQLARVTALLGYDAGMPCIIVNQPWTGDAFSKLMQAVRQPCVVLFDEFEKVYDDDAQKEVLTLFDGVFPTKKLFILTCNDRWLINDHMRNRPGRIYYMLEFQGLDQQFIIEYCNDQLVNKQYIDTIVKIASMFSQFNFDMLKAMVEELNRYGETPEQVLEMLNARPDTDSDGEYDVSVYINGKPMPQSLIHPRVLNGSPMYHRTLAVHFNADNVASDEPACEPTSKTASTLLASSDDELQSHTFRLTPRDLRAYDVDTGRFMYAPADHRDVVIYFTRQQVASIDLFSVI